MTRDLAFHPAVHGEVDEAYRFYEQRQAGLGDDFLVAVEEVFARLSAMPQAHQVIYRDVRRALPRRFPYAVYYRVHSDRVEVLAVQHSRRHPSAWKSRT